MSDINLKSKQSIDYSGNVTLKLKKGKKIISTRNINNIGTLRLFQGIALALSQQTGENLATLIPTYLGYGIGKWDSISINTSLNSLHSEIPSSRVELNVNSPTELLDNNDLKKGYIVNYSAVINKPLTGISEFGLFGDKNTNTLLAYIALPQGDYVDIESGMSLIIEWNIFIQNKEIK